MSKKFYMVKGSPYKFESLEEAKKEAKSIANSDGYSAIYEVEPFFKEK